MNKTTSTISPSTKAKRTIKAKKKSTLQDKFDTLYKAWFKSIDTTSSYSMIITNENYLSIIKLGTDAIPLMLKKMQEIPGTPFFRALQLLSSREDIGREYPGDFKRKSEAWIEWGKQEKYIK